ncbi:MAG: PEP-CTERM sorting domain-containing protein [Deltaproteobacteria bacterium]|nr:PEP-CTERM sorting domain-containing protein [Deltaproteobacteria bacterium]
MRKKLKKFTRRAFPHIKTSSMAFFCTLAAGSASWFIGGAAHGDLLINSTLRGKGLHYSYSTSTSALDEDSGLPAYQPENFHAADEVNDSPGNRAEDFPASGEGPGPAALAFRPDIGFFGANLYANGLTEYGMSATDSGGDPVDSDINGLFDLKYGKTNYFLMDAAVDNEERLDGGLYSNSHADSKLLTDGWLYAPYTFEERGGARDTEMPEPASLLLIGAAFAGAAVLKRKFPRSF